MTKKIILLGIGLLFSIASICQAASVTMHWEPSEGEVIGYKIFQKISTDEDYNFNQPVVIPNITDNDGLIPPSVDQITINDLSNPGSDLTYQWVCRAYSAEDVSDSSNQVEQEIFGITPPAPNNIMIAYNVNSNAILFQWQQLHEELVNGYYISCSETVGDIGNVINDVGKDISVMLYPVSFINPGEIKVLYFTIAPYRSKILVTENNQQIPVIVDKRNIQIGEKELVFKLLKVAQ